MFVLAVPAGCSLTRLQLIWLINRLISFSHLHPTKGCHGLVRQREASISSLHFINTHHLNKMEWCGEGFLPVRVGAECVTHEPITQVIPNRCFARSLTWPLLGFQNPWVRSQNTNKFTQQQQPNKKDLVFHACLLDCGPWRATVIFFSTAEWSSNTPYLSESRDYRLTTCL